MELLLALMLCGMVMSAAFAAVHLSWKYRSAGETQVEQSQVMRGVLQDMALDLRSAVVPPVPQQIDDELAEIATLPDEVVAAFKIAARKESSALTGLAEIEERVLEFNSIEPVDPVHFYGEPDFFVVLSGSPNYRFAASHDGAGVNSTLSHAVWWWNRGRSVRVPFSVRNDRIQRRTLTAESEYPGLIRVWRDVESPVAARSSPGNAAAIDQHEGDWTSIIGDLEHLSFRYSDGLDWKDSWNSHAVQALPTAVEFRFVRRQDLVERRFVLRLPQSTPHSAPLPPRETGVEFP